MLAFAASLPLSCPSHVVATPPAAFRRHPAVSTRRSVRPGALTMTAVPTDSDIRIRLYGNNIAITQSLSDYVDKKIGKVIRKYRGYCTKVDVHLTVQSSVPAGQACEVVVFSGKNILRREVRSADMYASIDEVEEKLGRTMRKFKERREAKKGKVTPVDSSVFVDVLDESENDMDDTFAPSASDEIASLMPNVEGIVKRKTFPLPLQTVEEAVLCLEYIDHSFYLFKMKDTGKVALVYRRNNGGYGLLEPENDS